MTAARTSARVTAEPAGPGGALARFARRTFDALTTDQARAILEIRPEPVGSVRRSGPEPYRILCFGGGVLRGLGIRDHNLGLPGQIADRVVEATGRGVRIDVVVDPAPASAKALALLDGLRIQRYDAVIVVLGDATAASPQANAWRGAMVGLSRLLLAETSAAAGIFIYDSSRAVTASHLQVGGARTASTDRLVEVTEEVCSLTGRIRFAELRLTPGAQDASGRFSEGTYHDWAETVVKRMRATFATLDAATDEASPRAYRNRPQDERLRQRALDALRLQRAGRNPALDREIAAAKAMYRSSGALFNLIDEDTQWAMASSDIDLPVTSRSDAFCNFAIESDELTLINDTWLNPRSNASPLAHGANPTRFYAGFPVHSIDGYRVGMVCVLGTRPRSLRPRELEGLRDVAGRIEQHLWNAQMGGGPRA